MKKKIIIISVMLVILSALFITVSGSMLTMYGPDGVQTSVFPYEVTEYKAAGWYENESDVIRTMYGADGSEITVYLSEVYDRIDSGWFLNKSDAERTLYAADGTEKVVFLAEVAENVKNGWYENKSDIEKTMYATDGTEKTIYIAQIEEFKADGWYESKEEVITTMYGPDGVTVPVFLADIEEYKAAGWYENKSDVERTLYDIYGTAKTVYLTQVEEHKQNGWYEDTSSITITMYADDGSETSVFLGKIDDYRANGWHSDKASVTAAVIKGGQRKTIYKSQLQSYLNDGWVRLQDNKANPSKPMVALTFDDGPRPASTGRILNVLEKYNARATFFVVGNFAVNNSRILNRMVSMGCQIGNHTYTHPNLKYLSAQGVLSEINRTAEVIKNAVGFYPTAIRPPYGSYGDTVRKVTEQPLILWSIDTLDWQHRNTNKIVDAILNNVRDGDIILMHDLYDTTAAAVEIVVPILVSRGYQLVTVEELAACHGGMSAHRAYHSFR